MNADGFEIVAGMSDLRAPVFNLALNVLDLLIDLDAFIPTVVDALLQRLQVALKMTDGLTLISQAVLMVSLTLANLILRSSNSSLEIADYLLQDLVVAFPELMVLDFFSIGVYDAISRVVSRNGHW